MLAPQAPRFCGIAVPIFNSSSARHRHSTSFRSYSGPCSAKLLALSCILLEETQESVVPVNDVEEKLPATRAAAEEQAMGALWVSETSMFDEVL